MGNLGFNEAPVTLIVPWLWFSVVVVGGCCCTETEEERGWWLCGWNEARPLGTSLIMIEECA